MIDGPPQRARDLNLPMLTIFKVIGSAVGLWAMFHLWPEFLLFLIAVLLAVTLHPTVLWMEGHGIGRRSSVLIIAGLAIGLLAVFVVFVLPPLTAQMTDLVQDFPNLRARVLNRIPSRYSALQDGIGELLRSPAMLERSLVWGQNAISGVLVVLVVLVLTLYLLLDGRSLYAWALAFVPRNFREKVADTAHEVSVVVHAYVSGQLLSTLLFTGFTAVVLTILGVPAVAPLAVIAGLCDIIPVLGIVLAIVPAFLVALAVSPGTAFGVVVAYLAYHLFETYFLMPRIYGKKLKISTLAVLLALIVGGKLQGIIGALLVLPLVAAYPIIERHWLAGYLRSRVLKDHKALAKAAETGSEVAIDAVLNGKKHPYEGAAAQVGK